MSLIEQAAKRLEELRRAGVDVPEAANKSSDSVEAPGTVESATARLRAAPSAPARKQRDDQAAAKAPSPSAPTDDSRRVHLDLAHLAAKGIVTPDAQRSRTADEFRQLYAAAGFHLDRIISTRSPLSIIEGSAA